MFHLITFNMTCCWAKSGNVYKMVLLFASPNSWKVCWPLESAPEFSRKRLDTWLLLWSLSRKSITSGWSASSKVSMSNMFNTVGLSKCPKSCNLLQVFVFSQKNFTFLISSFLIPTVAEFAINSSDFGGRMWNTNLVLGLFIPNPNALVATITFTVPFIHSIWFLILSSNSIWPW